MDIVSKLVEFCTTTLVLGYFFVLVLMMLRGQINMGGLLSDETGQTSPARLLALLINIAIAGGYLAEIAAAADGRFPDIPGEVLLALAGGNGYYLTSKIGGFRFGR